MEHAPLEYVPRRAPKMSSSSSMSAVLAGLRRDATSAEEDAGEGGNHILEAKSARKRLSLMMKIASDDKVAFDLEEEMPFWRTYGFERSMVKKVTAGGNVMRWKYTMAIGNGNGVGGFGQGKSKDPRRARVERRGSFEAQGEDMCDLGASGA